MVSEKLRNKILEDYINGNSVHQIAEEYEMSSATPYRILKNSENVK